MATSGFDVGPEYDEQVWAMRYLLEGAVNADLASKTSERKAIERTYGYPIPLIQVPHTKLPLLSVWRIEEALERHNDGVHWTPTIRIDYFHEACTLDKLETRWPLLKAVWQRCIVALGAGKHALVHNDDCVLESAGIKEVFVDDAKVRYDFASDGTNTYPGFTSTIPIRYLSDEIRDRDDCAVPLRSLFASYHLMGEDESPVLIVEDVVNVPEE